MAEDNDFLELLTLDGVVLRDYWTTVLDEVRDASRDVRRVADLGSGTGNGARGLVERFPSAEVIAVDSSEQMIERLAAAGLTTLRADLDDGFPAITDLDVTFASMSLHHVADPARLLGELSAATRPGGIVAAAEFAEPLRVLRDDYGDGLEDRVMSIVRSGHDMPDLHDQWGSRLTDAGFEIVLDRTFTVDLPAPVEDAARRYADLWLARLRHAADERLAAADRELLDAVATDATALHLHGTRTLVIGRKP